MQEGIQANVQVQAQMQFDWKQMHTFEAYVGGFVGMSYIIKYVTHENRLTYRAFEQSLDQDEIDLEEIGLKKREQKWGCPVLHVLSEGLDACAFAEWQDRYEMDCMDGTHWYVQIQWTDGEQIRKSGSNDFPSQWKAFCKLMKRITGKAFE